jgi:signal transduction histidine kinase
MSVPFRRFSLLWTFSAAFLGVVVVGALLQMALVYGVIRPAARHWLHSQGEVLARAGAQAVGTALDRDPQARIPEVLASVTNRSGLVALAYRDASGRFGGSDRPLGGRRPLWRGRRGRLGGQAPGSAVGPRAEGPVPPDPGDSANPGDLGGTSGTPQSRAPSPYPPLPGEPALRLGRPFPQFEAGPNGPEIGARVAVMVQGRPAGEVLAILPPLASLGWPEGIPRPSLLFVPIAAVLSGAAAYFLFRSLSRRLHRLEEHAERVASGDLDSRVPGLGGDEVGRLAESLNRMTDRLAEARRRVADAEEQRRRFLADAAHELSTPLTTIRGNTETLLDPGVPLAAADRQASLQDILAEAQRMDLLVRDLLDLARLESGAPEPAPELVDLAGLARECVRRFGAAYRDAGLALSGPGNGVDVSENVSAGAGAVASSGPGAEPGTEPGTKPSAGASTTTGMKPHIEADRAAIRGVPRRLEQILDNLLLNALRYVPRGGSVRVVVGRTGDEVHLIVEDDGPGFPTEDLPRIFDRFYRADRSRSPKGTGQAGGTGLGLAIVREIVRRHGGRIAAYNRAGGGACVKVELPSPKETRPQWLSSADSGRASAPKGGTVGDGGGE